MSLKESKFETEAERALDRLVESIDDLEDDALEAELESGVLSIRFQDGTKFVVNSHRAARQIWMAAGPVAWHFDLGEDGRWVASKSGDELFSTVSRQTSTKLGRSVQLG
mgnify:CR=1 FL=1